MDREDELKDLVKKAQKHVPSSKDLADSLSVIQEQRIKHALRKDQSEAKKRLETQAIQFMCEHMRAAFANIADRKIPVGRITLPRQSNRPIGVTKKTLATMRELVAQFIAEAAFSDLHEPGEQQELTNDDVQFQLNFTQTVQNSILKRRNKRTTGWTPPDFSRN